jgi:hypothetical protein
LAVHIGINDVSVPVIICGTDCEVRYKSSGTCLKRNLYITEPVLEGNFYSPGDPDFKDLY